MQAPQDMQVFRSVCLGLWAEMEPVGQMRTHAPQEMQRLSPDGFSTTVAGF